MFNLKRKVSSADNVLIEKQFFSWYPVLSRRFVWDYVSDVSTTLFDFSVLKSHFRFLCAIFNTEGNQFCCCCCYCCCFLVFFKLFPNQFGMCSQYRKIPIISPGAYIFQRPLLRGLYLEGLKFGGTYVRREIKIDWVSL